MKRQFTFIVFILLFSFCGKDETFDNSMSPCVGGNCAVVSGQFTTGHKEGVSNITVEVESSTLRKSAILTRKLGSGKTDVSGNYSFNINMYFSTNNETTSYKMIYRYDQYTYFPLTGLSEEFLSSFAGLNKEFTVNIYLPSLVAMNVRLENFVRAQEGDYFQVISHFPYGKDKEHQADFELHTTDGGENEIYGVGNDTTIVTINKMKAGILTTRDTAVYTPVSGEKIQLTFSY
jgi:hypothetical protein